MNTLYCIKKSLTYFMNLSFLCVTLTGCNRPIACLTKKCESTTQIESSQTTNGATEANPASTSTPQNAPTTDAITRELKLMKDREALSQLTDSVEQRIANIVDVSIEKLSSQAIILQKSRQEIEEKYRSEQQKAASLAVTRKAEYEKTIAALENISLQIAPQKFQLLAGIEAIESAILDPLTPEGVKTQIEMDQKISELDLARELSDKNLIEKIRSDMKQYINLLLVADKALILNLTDQLVTLSISMVDAHAPDKIVALLKLMIATEEKIQLLNSVGKPEEANIYKSKLEEINKSLQTHLNTLAPWQIEGVTKIEIGYQTALQTSLILSKYLSFIDSAEKTLGEKIADLRAKTLENKINIEKIKSGKIEFEGNMAFIPPSLGALAAVYDQIQVGIDQLNEGVKNAMTAQLKPNPSGPDPKSLDPFITAQGILVKNLDDILKAQANLSQVFASKAICSLGQTIKGPSIPLKEISCSGQKFVVIYPQ